MFTGIITNLGKLTKKEGSAFTFSAGRSFCEKIKKGTSIAINGVCLTTINQPTRNYFSIEVIPETLDKTMLGNLKINDLVNLELPVTPQTYLSGHIVQGHVDGASQLLGMQVSGNGRILKFSISPSLIQYLASKGSIAINGISLTVIEVEKDFFTVGIIPFTWGKTMLHTIKTGDFVNIEVDILAKYVERLGGK